MASLRLLVGGLVLCFSLAAQADKPASTAKSVSYFEHIRPIFQAHCQGCHQPAKDSGDYVMTTFAGLLKGGESESAAIVPGKPDKSYLIDLITPVDGTAEMPKDKKRLSDVEIELIRNWITQGAKDDTPANARQLYDAKHPPIYTSPPVVTSMDYSPDGKYLAVAGFHEVLLHKADGSGLVARLIGLSERIECVRFSPDGKRLAVAGGQPSRGGEIQIWNVEKRILTQSHTVTYDTVYGARWSADGKLIAFGCGDNTFRVIEAKSGKQVLFQGSHSGWVLDTVFSAKGTHVISVARDRTVKLTELKTERFIDNVTSITPGALKGGIAAIERHPTNDEILVGGADGIPKIYRIFRKTKRVIGDDANLIRKFPALKGRVFDVAISRDGKQIAAGSSLNGSGEVRIYAYDFDTGLPKDLMAIMQKRTAQRTPQEKEKLDKYRKAGVRVVAEIPIPTGGVYAVTFGADGKTLAAAGSDGTVRLINVSDGKIVKEFIPVKVTPADQVAKSSQSKKVIAGPEPETPTESINNKSKLVSLTLVPSVIKLTNEFDYSQLLISGRLQAGDTIDVTRIAKISVSTNLINVSRRGLIRPVSNGIGELTVTIGGKTAKVPVHVSGIDKKYPVDFRRDVMPALSRLGCNAGTCHGARVGKGGFKLSLRGYDNLYDARAFTDDLKSRRVNIASPENSLMLLKSTSAVPHFGGQVTRPGEPYYRIIHNWIGAGAKLDLSAPKVTRIEIFPKNPVVQRIGSKQQIRVLATYSDNLVRDVTRETFLESGDTEIASADDAGLVSTLRRGEAPILARFEGAYAVTTLTVMGDRSGFASKQTPANNKIDTFVAAKLKRVKVLSSGLCTDAEFVRRIYLDLTGLPPTADDVQKFLADKRDTQVKRDELIDKLIGNEDYIDHWSNKWADLLQVNRKFLGPEGAKMFRDWIRKEIADNTPYDEFVRKILTASGSNRKNPPAAYFKILRTPQDTMENTTQLFLAVRFSCNKCHDHPFERWTQDQYYETAAYLAQFELKKDPTSGKKQIGRTAVEKGKPLYEIVSDRNSGEVKHDRTGAVTAPRFPYPVKIAAKKDAPRRTQLAQWITSTENPYFAKSYVNRLWGYLLGIGLIEPLDDIRAGNPPTNPELLNYLTEEFIANKLDVRHIVKLICKSRTYQLSIQTNEWNADDRINYSHAMARRLPAEVLFDAIHRVVGAVSKIPGVPPGTRAAQLPDSGVKLADGFLSTLGRPVRESACECERSSGMQMGPVMAFVSGPTLNNAVNDASNELAKLAKSAMTDDKLVEIIFLRIVNRPPTKFEVEACIDLLKTLPDDHESLAAELKKYEKELQPILVKREQKRQAAIVTAKTDLQAYEKEIAPREAKLDREQKERTEKLAAKLAEYEKTLAAKLVAWETKQKQPIVWSVLDPIELSATNQAKLTKEKDLSVFATGKNGNGTYKFVTKSKLLGITGIRLELLTDKRLPKNGPGRAPDGNYVLTEFRVEAAPADKPKEKKSIKLQNAQADFSQQNYNIKTAIDGKQAAVNNGWASAPKLGVNRTAVFETKTDLSGGDGTLITFLLDHKLVGNKHTIGKFRISVTNSPRPVRLGGLPEKIAKIMAVPTDQRKDAQKAELLKYYRSIDAELKKRQTALAKNKKPRPVDPKLKNLQDDLAEFSKPLPIDQKLVRLRSDVTISTQQLKNQRVTATQDIAWALINTPAFMFNH